MHKMPRIWTQYLELLVQRRKVTRARRTFDRALQALPITQHDRVWVLYLVRLTRPPLAEPGCRVLVSTVLVSTVLVSHVSQHVLSPWQQSRAPSGGYVVSSAEIRHAIWHPRGDGDPCVPALLEARANARGGVHCLLEKAGRLLLACAA